MKEERNKQQSDFKDKVPKKRKKHYYNPNLTQEYIAYGWHAEIFEKTPQNDLRKKKKKSTAIVVKFSKTKNPPKQA